MEVVREVVLREMMGHGGRDRGCNDAANRGRDRGCNRDCNV
jgi:hypothetical protein